MLAFACFSGAAWGQADTDHPAVSLYIDELRAAQKQVSAYDPKTKISVAGGTSYNWLLRAVSPKERKNFMGKWGPNMTTETRVKFDTGLDALSKTAAAKIPLAMPEAGSFPIKNAIEEKKMLAAMSDVPGIKVYGSGLEQSAWLIDKNGYGIPTARYKHGRIWGKNPSADYPYCRFWFVNIIQDYAGGGRYGASRAKFVDTNFAACPEF